MADKRKRTNLVHGGTRRSQYGEVSEAIYLTQGFVYDSAEQAEARFEETGPDEFIYARYGNPTVAMFEERLRLVEDAPACWATAFEASSRSRSGYSSRRVRRQLGSQPTMGTPALA